MARPTTVAGERDVIVIGGGQSALAVGYYLHRTRLAYAVLDDGGAPGGAWRHTWSSQAFLAGTVELAARQTHARRDIILSDAR